MRIHNTVIWTFVYIYVVYRAKLSESSQILVESRAGTQNTDNDYNGLQIYTLDDSGSTVKNDSSKYKIIQLRANNVLVFNFNDNAKCTIVKHNGKDVWTIDTGDTPLLPNGQKEYPRKVSFNSRNVIFVYFKEKTLGYLLKKGEWRFMIKGDSLNVIEQQKIPILVITGPSGSGKTTLNTRLINDYSDIFENSVSCTTRAPREGEQDGVNYYFITMDEFNQKINNNEFLEHAEYAGNKYGTLKSELNRIRAENKIPVLEIDIQGCRSLRNQGMGMKNLFIDPGDLNVLRQRLVDRGGLTEEKINSRIERAEKEIEEAKKFPFHYTLKNDSDIDTVYYTFIDKLKEWYPDHNLKHKIPILVITGPSGSGKTTLNTRLIHDYSDIFANSVSCTTRDPREGEKEGVNYYFITKDEFNQKIENNEFLEHAEYAGNKYGTLKSELNRIRAENKIPVLEIDIQGCRSLRNQGMGMKNLFIDPGDLNVLRQRLVDRGGLTEEKINSRIERAEKEIEEAKKFPFHYTLKNDSDIDTVYYTFIDKLKEWYPDHNLKHKIPILVITGPSGSGKTTLNTRLIHDYSDIFANSVSCTTRDPREGEKEGVNYYFITKDEFNQKIENNEFLEHAEYAGNKYGTLKSELNRIRAENKIPVLEIDIQGCRSLRNQGMGMKNLFIDPGDLNVLRQRLVDRGGLTEEKINSRIERAEKEIEEAKNFGFDYTLENKGDIDTVYSTLIDKLKEWFEPPETN